MQLKCFKSNDQVDIGLLDNLFSALAINAIASAKSSRPSCGNGGHDHIRILCSAVLCSHGCHKSRLRHSTSWWPPSRTWSSSPARSFLIYTHSFARSNLFSAHQHQQALTVATPSGSGRTRTLQRARVRQSLRCFSTCLGLLVLYKRRCRRGYEVALATNRIS